MAHPRTKASSLRRWNFPDCVCVCVCDPSMACFCRVIWMLVLFFFPSDSFSPAVTLVVAPVITGITKLFYVLHSLNFSTQIFIFMVLFSLLFSYVRIRWFCHI
jgi:hypothetical protein